jgi:hypothetical protein
MWRCRVLGHRFRFTSEGRTMRWACERGCGAGGSKTYETVGDAQRYARALDRDDRADLGRRAPVGLVPLRMMRAVRGRWRAHGNSQ